MFKSKTVIVTGGASGIGFGVAKGYVQEGAHVVIADCDRDKGSLAEAELNKIIDINRAIFIQTDVRSEQDIIHLMEQTKEVCGGIDILINNAGVSRFQNMFEMKTEEWDDILSVNLRGYFICAREAAKVMKEQKGGSIVNIASTRALMSEPDSEAYAASKGGITALTHAMALSLSEYDIRVNAISPGWIETGDYESLRDIDHEQHPSKRVGKPSDIWRACCYLTDPKNDFVNGENIIVDGGMTRKMIYEH
ncbi:glucose 1-dehydrogenase [Bacillus tianshenii]|nr:glucose 1-dehydrogenase [Bacillus tianshenii]